MGAADRPTDGEDDLLYEDDRGGAETIGDADERGAEDRGAADRGAVYCIRGAGAAMRGAEDDLAAGAA